MRLLARLEKSKDFWFLLPVTLVFFLLRLPSLFEPYWYGDEGIYEVVGMGIRSGRLLYHDIWDNKPPLLYLFYALVNGDLFSVRLLSLLTGIGAIIAFYFLAKKLLVSQKTAMISSAIFAILFGIPLIEGNIANSENFMMLPTLLAAICLLTYLKERKEKLLFFSGILLAVSFMLKVVAVFDVAAFLLFFALMRLITLKKMSYEQLFYDLSPFFVGFLTPIILTAVFFVLTGSLSDFFHATFQQNVGYVGYGNAFLIGQGFLIIKLVFLSLFLWYLFLRRFLLPSSLLFILIWSGFSLFNAFFSQRPYTHYLLVFLPSFCLLVGSLFLQDESIQVKKYKRLAGLALIFLVFIFLKSFWIYDKTGGYYANFLSFVFGKKDVVSFEQFFDKKTPLDYEIAQFIRLHTTKEDNIFIWGNNAQVYKLTGKLPPGRYTVAYHIKATKESLAETREAIERNKPMFIVVMNSADPFPFPLTYYNKRITIKGAIIYERVL